MNEKNTKYLYKKYPKLFPKEIRENPILPMYWGFMCGDGWFWLIDKLCECIQTYVDNNKKPQPVVAQVKEKFGGLRYYVDNTDDTIEGMIWFAEHLSYSICEICGKKGKLFTQKGWLKTRCEKHKNK